MSPVVGAWRAAERSRRLFLLAAVLLAASILASVVAAVAAAMHGPGGLRTVASLLLGVTGAVAIAGLVVGLADSAGRAEAMRWIVLNGVVAVIVGYFLSGLLPGR